MLYIFISCVNVSYSVIKSVVLEINMSHVVSILTEKQFPSFFWSPQVRLPADKQDSIFENGVCVVKLNI